MQSANLTSTEKRAIFSISTIMALRMIGLFMVLPLFSMYAEHLSGSTPFLIGVGMGIYGLCQALFQIPFGSLSDKYGRKKIITIGLGIFILGSIVSGLAQTMPLLILGRALQGIGAVGSTLLALTADLTREDQRTKAMAISGITIGFSFSIAMVVGPILTQWFAINTIFYFAAVFGAVGIGILYLYVPNPQSTFWHRDTEPEMKAFVKLLLTPDLAKLNIGIFLLHALFTATFLALPINLLKVAGFSAHQQWLLYLPSLLLSFIAALICIGFAERKQQLKPYFLGGIVALGAAEILFLVSAANIPLLFIALCLFFGGFSLLEAFLPSLITRTAPAARKGTALGIYSCSQFFGIFIGGVVGGWLFGRYSYAGVYFFSIALALFWFILASFMQPPRFLVSRMWRIDSNRTEWDMIALKLHAIPGMVEVTYIAEDGICYLKMERSTPKHPDFIDLKQQLQCE